MRSSISNVDKEDWWFGGIAQWATLLLCVFLVMLPKGGVKAGSVPITWGFVLIALFAICALPSFLHRTDVLHLRRSAFLTLVCTLPFQAILILGLTRGAEEVGFALAAVLNFIVLPVIFLVLWRPWYTDRVMVALVRILRLCVLAAAVYGIIAFVLKLMTGTLIEIPFLTINAADAGQIEGKFNDRGGIFKLVSTYNNGNIYGVCTLMLLPLFEKVEKSTYLRLLVRVAIVLSLSRTVWAGLIVERLLSMTLIVWRATRQFPKIESKLFRRFAANVLLLGTSIMAVLLMIAYAALVGTSHINLDFLWDSSLGGRDSQLNILSNFHLLTIEPFKGFSEMVFLSALSDFGLVGFLAMILVYLSPLVVMLQDGMVLKDPIRRAAFKGMLLYFLVAWIDGAVDFIPVMAIYWLIAVVMIYWPVVRTASIVKSEPGVVPIQREKLLVVALE